jgi:hypothetical protein
VTGGISCVTPINKKCAHCGSIVEHQGICPTVKAIEYYPDGTVKRVEYKCAGDYGPVQHYTYIPEPVMTTCIGGGRC